MGAAPAQMLAALRPGARGAVLMHGALPPQALGVERWPASVPVQVHFAVDDPWVDADAVAALEASAPRGLVDTFRYPGDGHLFADADAPEHDAESAALLLRRVRDFLARVGAAASTSSAPRAASPR